MFPGSRNFTVAGGTFTNVTNNYVSAPYVPPDFRMIPMGDIDLQREIRVDEIRLDDTSGVAFRDPRSCVRRVFSAKVADGKVEMTVALYEGEAAEEEWRREISQYMAARHPHIIQLCGAASSGGIHATLFHGDLIPYTHFLDLYRNYPILTVYIHGYTSAQLSMAKDYFFRRFQKPLLEDYCTFWMRRSSGLLCAELLRPAPKEIDWTFRDKEMSAWEALASVSAPDQENKVIRCLSLRQYHEICRSKLSLSRHDGISTFTTVALGAVVLWAMADRFENCQELAYVRGVEVASTGWYPDGPEVFNMADGSARYTSHEVLGETFKSIFYVRKIDTWLSQANHIFHRLRVTDNFVDHVMVDRIRFSVRVLPSVGTPPGGYLFLCPQNEFQTGSSSFKWPDWSAYWSLDPLGVERLTAKEATSLGFPSLLFTTTIAGRSWDASVYTGLRQFHTAKGFDPESQEIARHLGCPMYTISSRTESPLVRDTIPLAEDSPDEEGVPFSEVRTARVLESTEPAKSHEPWISHTLNVVTNIQLALILFLLLCQVYEMVGESRE
ncbi:hypothetical protein C8F04DRAFT_1099284 [Mycena alexandri]|uniref:Uncharacterized protein n=1 Tax=Mycena alexandri TaxID=1745969 RepID=A0AAD6SZI3_9AGAR|nr:hypothetical protein C8F04DRAFT_1099284 [Mycena alexandri]